MSAPILTDAGNPVPDELMSKWCEMWANGDRRLRVAEISTNVFGRPLAATPGQLWERVRDADQSDGAS